MAVDLRNNTLFQRLSVVILPDCLVKLEHQMTKDRVRKTMFNRVSQLTVWRRTPWGRIAVVSMFPCVPGILLVLFPEETSLKVLGAILLCLGLAINAWYLYCGKTTLLIVSPGKTDEITGIFRPGKVRRFVDRTTTSIRTLQAPPLAAPPIPPLAPDLNPPPAS